MRSRESGAVAGDLWGGLAAMLVALPSAIAFGVTVYAPLGGSYAAYGALAGILGATALGLIAPALGGTNRLITAPCAPAAAVLSALAIELTARGVAPESALLMLLALGLITGVLQLLFGFVGLGRLIKYMPYPVVSGYMSAVGLTIVGSQVPIFLGAPKGTPFWESLASPSLWRWQAVAVGAMTVAVTVGASKLTRAVPAAILGLAGGLLGYLGLGLADRTLLATAGNPLVVGPLGGSGAGFFDALLRRFGTIGHLGASDLLAVLVPALTLAVLLSIDTLKTCVVLDAVTRSRHDSNRELVGQGIGNIASAVIGGMPGSGTIGATLVNISSGARTRLSSLTEGALSLAALLALGSLIAWLPVAALSGILIVIGARMCDRSSLHFLKSRSTVLDFAVIAAVIATALAASLIVASGVGVALAVVLFIREQIGGTVVRHKAYGAQMSSKRVRLPSEVELLKKRGDETVIFELQGSLFFGTADQLYTALEGELRTRRYVILDMRRVQSVDATAAHVLGQVEAILVEREGFLLFSEIPQHLPSGRDMQQYFDQVGLVRAEGATKVFGELDDALEWVEDRILSGASLERREERPLELHEIDLFDGHKPETLAALDACMERRSFKAGEAIFSRGDPGAVLYLIRRGAVRIVLPLNATQSHHVGTFGRGDFFGEMAFLDGDVRSADAVAFTDTDLFVLPRERFDAFAEAHRRMAIGLLEGLARVLAVRLRYTNGELRALQE